MTSQVRFTIILEGEHRILNGLRRILDGIRRLWTVNVETVEY